MFQSLPMIMGMLNEKKKSDEAAKQNQISAMLGQAPTAQGGNILQGAMAGFQPGNPANKNEAYDKGDRSGKAIVNKIEGAEGPRVGGLTAGTNSMLDSALGPLGKHTGGPSDEDEDDLTRV